MDRLILATAVLGLFSGSLALTSIMNIHIFYDETLNTWNTAEYHIMSTKQLIDISLRDQSKPENSSNSCCEPNFTLRSVQSVNILELIRETNNSEPVIFLISCSHCGFMEKWSDLQYTRIYCVLPSARYEIRSCVSYSLMNNVWSSLVRRLLMYDVVIFYDFGSASPISTIEDSLPSTYTTVWPGDTSLSSDTNVRVDNDSQAFPSVTGRSHSNFIVSANIENALDIIQMSNKGNLFGPEFNWLVDMRTDPETAHIELPTLLQDGDNTAVVLLAETYQEYLKTEVNDSIQQFMTQQIELPQQSPTYTDILTYPVLDVYKCVAQCSTQQTLSLVSSVYSDGLLNNASNIFPDTFRGFQQRLFKIVTKVYEPFVILDKYADGTERYRGMCIEILDALATSLDFRYELFGVEDGKFGVRNSTGYWNGLIGTVHRHEADMAVTGITVSSGRAQVVDYTFPFWEEPSTVLLKKPKDESKLASVFAPFKMSTWYGIIGGVFGSALLLSVISSMTTRIVGLYEPLQNYWQSLWYTYGALLGQGTDLQPMSLSCRLVASSWWIVIIVLYAVYTGNLIAFLTVNIPNMPFNDLLGMVTQTEYRYGLEDGIIHMMLFMEAESGIYSDIWRGIQRHYDSVIVETTELGLEKVINEPYAFIGEKTFLQTKSSANCDLVMIQEEFFKSNFAFALPKGWPFKKYFDEAITSLVETGFINHWKKKHFVSPKCAAQAAAVELRATQLDDMSGLFVVIMFGGLIAAVSLLMEVIYYKFRRRKNKTPTCMPHEPQRNGENSFSNEVRLEERTSVELDMDYAQPLDASFPNPEKIFNIKMIPPFSVEFSSQNGDANHHEVQVETAEAPDVDTVVDT